MESLLENLDTQKLRPYEYLNCMDSNNIEWDKTLEYRTKGQEKDIEQLEIQELQKY